jgi:chloramphenicol O-acetyltransferase
MHDKYDDIKIMMYIHQSNLYQSGRCGYAAQLKERAYVFITAYLTLLWQDTRCFRNSKAVKFQLSGIRVSFYHCVLDAYSYFGRIRDVFGIVSCKFQLSVDCSARAVLLLLIAFVIETF